MYAKPKYGYWVALGGGVAGAAAGSFLVNGLLLVNLFFDFDEPEELFWYTLFFGPPVGMAIGITAALAVFKRNSPVLTGLVSLPISALAYFGFQALALRIETMDMGWMFLLSPILVPFASRWVVRLVRPGQSWRLSGAIAGSPYTSGTEVGSAEENARTDQTRTL
jgi:hypothetical protein